MSSNPIEDQLTDEQKHAEARRRGYPHAVLLPPDLYRAAAEAGEDLSCYVEQKPVPKT